MGRFWVGLLSFLMLLSLPAAPLWAAPTPPFLPSPPPLVADPVLLLAPNEQDRDSTQGWLTPSGGALQWEALDLVVRAGAGALHESVRLVGAAAPALPPLAAPIGVPFTLNALDRADPTAFPLTHPLTLTVRFDLDEAEGERGSPTLYRWQPDEEGWERLPSGVDWATQRVSAPIWRGGRFALGWAEGGSYGVQSVPTMNGISSDAFTGNSSLRYPLRLPPGPGGLSLPLALGYSSEGVNALLAGNPGTTTTYPFARQAGMWNLHGLGSITRELRNPLTGEGNRIFLTYSGGAFQLRLTEAGWQTAPHSFLKIETVGSGTDDRSLWRVWTPDGVRYTFGSTAGNADPSVAYNVYPGDGCPTQFREAHLTEVLDPHGNRIEIRYVRELGEVPPCLTSYVRAVRPLSAHFFPSSDLPPTQQRETVRLLFSYESRPDVEIVNHANFDVQSYLTAYRLTSLTMQLRTGAGSEDFATSHYYSLEQDFAPWPEPRPDPEAESIMRLRAIHAHAPGELPLPAWRFDYESQRTSPNFTLLTGVRTGQGGQASFVYEEVPNILIRQCGPGANYSRRYRVSRLDLWDGLGNVVQQRYRILPPGETDVNLSAFAKGYEAEFDCTLGFEFGGFQYARRELWGGEEVATTHHQTTITRYHQAIGIELDARRGRAWWQQLLAPDGSEMQRTESSWDAPTLDGVPWVRQLAQQVTVAGAVSHRTTYEYEPSMACPALPTMPTVISALAPSLTTKPCATTPRTASPPSGAACPTARATSWPASPTMATGGACSRWSIP